MRLVLDTNIIISGLLSPNAPPGCLLDLWDENKFYTLISAEEQMAELLRVANYPKLSTRLRPTIVHHWVNAIRSFGVMMHHLPHVTISPDPNDDYLLALADMGNADLLVTGDKRDLLALKRYKDTRIVTARVALEMLKNA